jgi:hypothetical protein
MTSHPKPPQIFSDLESLLTYASLDLIQIYVPPATRTSKMNNLYALRSQIQEIIHKSRSENFQYNPTPDTSQNSEDSNNSLYEDRPTTDPEPNPKNIKNEISEQNPNFSLDENSQVSDPKKFQNSTLTISSIMSGFDYRFGGLDLSEYYSILDEDELFEFEFYLFGNSGFNLIKKIAHGDRGKGCLQATTEDHISLFYGARKESYKFILTVIYGSLICLVGDSYSLKHFFVEKANEIEGSVIFGGCFAEIQNLIRKNTSKKEILDFFNSKAFGDGIFQENLIDFGKSLIVNGHH